MTGKGGGDQCIKLLLTGGVRETANDFACLSLHLLYLPLLGGEQRGRACVGGILEFEKNESYIDVLELSRWEYKCLESCEVCRDDN